MAAAAPAESGDGDGHGQPDSVNHDLDDAILSLGGLQTKIQSFITADAAATPLRVSAADDGAAPETLESAVQLIQSLIADTKQQCIQMSDKSDRLTAKFDTKLTSCHGDMEHLRRELDEAQRCVHELEANLAIAGSGTESDHEENAIERQLELSVYRLREENGRLKQQLRAMHRDVLALRTRNVAELAGGDGGGVPTNGYVKTTNKEMMVAIAKLQADLDQAKDGLSASKAERKRLKAEKCDMLQQMKEVYSTLEGKERELRSFIRQYEQKMRDCDDGLQRALAERDRSENELQRLGSELDEAHTQLYNARAEAQAKQDDNQDLLAQLRELQGRFYLLAGQHATPPSNADQLYTPSVGYGSCSASPSVADADAEGGAPSDASTPPPPSFEVKLRSRSTRLGRESTSGRLSRLFRLTKPKSVAAHDESPPADPIAADLQLAECAERLLEARRLPVDEWRQAHVLAWVQLELGFGTRVCRAVAESVKSGKVLLTLMDSEFSHEMGIVHPLQKKKLRLAIEEYRLPNLCAQPALKETCWQYTVSHFLPACGLPQYEESFRENLVDGRVLNQISRKQLEKYLNVTKKSHQMSILQGVELLRKFMFDTKLLAQRRQQCDKDNCDLLVWTNQRLRRWLEGIDLGDFAANVDQSGLHGASMVFEPNFNADTFAAALRIPSNKPTVRQHLSSEFLPLLFDARSRLKQEQISPQGGGLQRQDCSMIVSGSARDSPPGIMTTSMDLGGPRSARRRSGFRDSFGKVFGLRGRSQDARRRSGHLPQSKSMPESAGALHGTMSSTTSDLGSSIERSQHMRTILGTPTVLARPSLTGLSACKLATLSASIDSAVCTADDTDASPPQPDGAVRLRSRSATRLGAAPPRPHSLGSFVDAHGERPRSARRIMGTSALQQLNCPPFVNQSDVWYQSDEATHGGEPSTRDIGTICEQSEALDAPPKSAARPQSLDVAHALAFLQRRPTRQPKRNVQETDL